MNTELTQFVRKALARGLAREQIRAALAAARWRPEEIESALAAWAEGEAGLPVPRRRMSLSAREAFQHLVLFATLYLFTFNVGALAFALVDGWFRDAAADINIAALDVMRWATSGALTTLPIYLWMHRVVQRSLVREPEKRDAGVRRWLTYLTLFAAALVLIGNFSGLVAKLLGGELNVRFVLKTLVVFAIAGGVFGHFMGGLRREESEDAARPRRAGVLGRAGIALAMLTIAAGLVTAGSPGRARTRQLDARRLDDLQRLETAVRNHHVGWGRLPASLDELSMHDALPRMPHDPVTGRSYGYEVVDSITFRLSATFATADTLRPGGEAVAPIWRHVAGHAVFTRVVAPDHRAPGLHVEGRPAPLAD